jgi:hypothetical protein
MQNSNSTAFNLFNKSAGATAAFKVATEVEKEEAIRVLAAGNALIGLVSASPRRCSVCQMLTFHPTNSVSSGSS